MHLKLLQKKGIRKSAEATGDLIGNRIADETTRVSRTLPKNITRTVINETENIGLDIEIPKERNISPEKRENFINDLRLV